MVRVFLDDVGVRWEVREIGDVALADLPAHRMSHSEFATGWLFFSSDAERRRVAPYPSNWLSLSPFELATLCRRAVPVRRRQTPAVGAGHSWSKYS